MTPSSSVDGYIQAGICLLSYIVCEVRGDDMAGQAVRDYLREVESKLATGVAGEHVYREALELLLRKLGSSDLVVVNEPKRVKAGQPDFVVKQRIGFGLSSAYIYALGKV
jgi:hypothetical protein